MLVLGVGPSTPWLFEITPGAAAMLAPFPAKHDSVPKLGRRSPKPTFDGIEINLGSGLGKKKTRMRTSDHNS